MAVATAALPGVAWGERSPGNLSRWSKRVTVLDLLLAGVQGAVAGGKRFEAETDVGICEDETTTDDDGGARYGGRRDPRVKTEEGSGAPGIRKDKLQAAEEVSEGKMGWLTILRLCWGVPPLAACASIINTKERRAESPSRRSATANSSALHASFTCMHGGRL